MSNLVRKKLKDIYGNLWNEVAHDLGELNFRIVGHIDGYITLFGDEKDIQKFLDELNKRV